MKVLQIGLGSMGKRRVRNLIACGIGFGQIVGVDGREDRRSEARAKYGIEVAESISGELLDAADLVVISTPPDRHVPYARLAAQHNKHMFIEASVLDAGLAELNSEVVQKGLVAFPSCTMRFFDGPKRVSEILASGELGKVLTWQYQSGQYLPDWHPWEPISDYYVSNRPTGACREIVPFEMVWLEPLFGKVIEIDARHEKVTALDADIDDVYLLQMRHASGALGQLIVDVIGRAPIRSLRVTCSEGTLIWDDTRKTIETYRASDAQWCAEKVGIGSPENGYINPEEPYISEMNAFLKCVSSRKQPEYSLSDDIETLALLYAAEAASRERARKFLS